MDELGMSPIQSFGFAHNELAYRLEIFPNEVPLALIALSVCLLEFHHLNELDPDIGFIPELMENMVDSRIDAAVRDLDKSDMKEFDAALAKVKLEISSETPL
ncbi:hypothetical protein L4C38_00265 [Vibrio kasasachensis]|uniref:hypothetical protein n=1 Tax=Vibrio kasasachensis TaxID=2910248 RepID=UPI003D0CB94C